MITSVGGEKVADEGESATNVGPRCDFPGCDSEGTVVSRLSPEGYLVATGKKAYSYREAYRRFNYCKKHHDDLMSGVWSRITFDSNKDDDHVAPTSI